MRALRAVAAIGGLILVACVSSPPERPFIAASTPPLAALARMVAPDDMDVLCIAPGGDPHHAEPAPATVFRLAQAALVVRMRPGAEPWLDGVLGQAGVSALSPGELDAHLAEVEEHFWTDPMAAARWCAALAEHMPEPSRAAARARAAAFGERARRLLIGAPDSGPPVLLDHASATGLARSCGLRIAGVLGGSGEAHENRLGDFAEWAVRARETGVAVLVADASEGADLAAGRATQLELALCAVQTQPAPDQDWCAWWSGEAQALTQCVERAHGKP